jgi:hypothetical protein
VKPSHDCPGGCHRPVPHHRFACGSCWQRLPEDIRRRIVSSHGRDPDGHWDAVTDAFAWYRDHDHRSAPRDEGVNPR